MIDVKKLSPEDWEQLSFNAHLTVFAEERPFQMERISYALLAIKNDVPFGYATVRELDSESVYWQYGGAFPSTSNTLWAVRTYELFIEWSKREGIKRISTYVASSNVRYLKLAMHVGFRIIGTRTFKGEVYVELLNEFGGELCGQS